VQVPENIDVLIVGSGPVGSTFARELTLRLPKARIVLVDAGPRLTPRAGVHIKNIADPAERAQAQVLSQGPTAYPYSVPTLKERSEGAVSERAAASTIARAGTYLLDYLQDGSAGNMPAAAMSTNVGGMGAHWTCACPRPGNAERISLISEAEWNELCTRAEHLLRVHRDAYPDSAASRAIVRTLGEVFNADRPTDRRVGTMPLACTPTAAGGRVWSGPAVILEELADPQFASDKFSIVANTVCLRLETGDAGAEAAILQDRVTGETQRVRAKYFVIAADALRTPQVLAASQLGGRANGHYLNDQPQSIGLVQLNEETEKATSGGGSSVDVADSTVGVLWVPFHAPSHPFHGQVMHLDTSPIPLKVAGAVPEKGHFVGLGWFAAKDVRYEDYLEFSAEEKDFYGMPKMKVHYALTEKDKQAIAQSLVEQARAAKAFGWFVPGGEPRTVPAGSSLHYQGTTRMGETDDGTSVCDSYSQLWDARNVFVGGNNVIPTATACNPTMSSVALAVRASQRISSLLA
jgi:choline dehydrogenase-like flavoprotein